jgi:transposase
VISSDAKADLVQQPTRGKGRLGLQLAQVLPQQFPDHQVDLFEQRMREAFKPTPEIALLITLPGVGFILAVVIALEVGDDTRFASNEKFAAYAGATPRVHASGGRIRYGPLRSDVNHYLKWAFVEAATVICRTAGGTRSAMSAGSTSGSRGAKDIRRPLAR